MPLSYVKLKLPYCTTHWFMRWVGKVGGRNSPMHMILQYWVRKKISTPNLNSTEAALSRDKVTWMSWHLSQESELNVIKSPSQQKLLPLGRRSQILLLQSRLQVISFRSNLWMLNNRWEHITEISVSIHYTIRGNWPVAANWIYNKKPFRKP